MSLNNLLKLANKFEIKFADGGDNTPIDKLSYAQISAYLQAAGLIFTGVISEPTFGFTLNQVKYKMAILDSERVRFMTLDGRMWSVPHPSTTVQRNAYIGHDMPLILQLVKNTLKQDQQAHPQSK